MNFSTAEMHQLLVSAEHAARQAAAIIQQADRQALDISRKSTGTSEASQVVTQIDTDCEAAIFAALESCTKQFDLGWLGEESAQFVEGQLQSRLEKTAFWCIDPLDGTLPFIHNEPGYAVAVALVSKAGEPLLGVVLDPRTDSLYSAGVHQRITVQEAAACTKPEALRFHTDRSFLTHSHYRDRVAGLTQVAQSLGYSALQVVAGKGAVMNACAVLDDPHSFYLKLPKKTEGGGCLWDFSATCALFQAAEKPVSDCNNRPLRLNNPESLYMNEAGVLYSGDHQLHQELIDWLRVLPSFS
mgnify:CR=1 FL=1